MDEKTPTSLLVNIFNHQHALASRYLSIERANGLLQTDAIPVDIDDNKGQARIKDMTWRCVEEVAEALKSLDDENEVHFLEELSDAMHFLIEKFLLCGIRPEEFLPLEELFRDSVDVEEVKRETGVELTRYGIVHMMAIEFVKSAGMSCNCLKNRPWKQSQVSTNVVKLRMLLRNEMFSFIDLCKAAGFTAQTLYDAYMYKNMVNINRQEGGY